MKLFFDSSIIIETFKGNNEAIEIIKKIEKIEDKNIFINCIVFSEVSYQLSVRRTFSKDEIFEFLNSFLFLDVNFSVVLLSQKYMKKYNLKPNDALISATIKYYNIDYLVTLDEDYKNLDLKVFE